jgi:hypothetical protein
MLLLALFSGLAISAWRLERVVPEAQDADRH